MSSIAQPMHVSVTVAMVFVPVVGLWIEICLLQTGLAFGFAGLLIKRWEMATMASPFVLVSPQEPGKFSWSALFVIWGDIDERRLTGIDGMGKK